MEENKIFFDLAQEESDESTEIEVEKNLGQIEKGISGLELQQMLQEEDDHSDAIVVIHSGAGGTEAQDWVSMLLRMYLRWAEKNNYRTGLIDTLPGEEAGIKNGDALRVYRSDRPIANIEAIQVRRNISACDIKKQGAVIKIGDTVR